MPISNLTSDRTFKTVYVYIRVCSNCTPYHAAFYYLLSLFRACVIMALHNLLFLAMSAILNSYTSALIATPQPTVPNYFRGNNWERIKKKKQIIIWNCETNLTQILKIRFWKFFRCLFHSSFQSRPESTSLKDSSWRGKEREKWIQIFPTGITEKWVRTRVVVSSVSVVNRWVTTPQISSL